MADDTKKDYTKESEKEIKEETMVEVEPSDEEMDEGHQGVELKRVLETMVEVEPSDGLTDEGHQGVELKRVLYSFGGGGLQQP
ncbi:hypothetical protein GBA52_003716 [Prunus armeniaca]|nr:hypothetical protein GBA52_003716 [Prunus armeniaca]